MFRFSSNGSSSEIDFTGSRIAPLAPVTLYPGRQRCTIWAGIMRKTQTILATSSSRATSWPWDPLAVPLVLSLTRINIYMNIHISPTLMSIAIVRDPLQVSEVRGVARTNIDIYSGAGYKIASIPVSCFCMVLP